MTHQITVTSLHHKHHRTTTINTRTKHLKIAKNGVGEEPEENRRCASKRRGGSEAESEEIDSAVMVDWAGD